MKLWVDDERAAPDDSWTVAVSSEDAISHLYMLGTPAVIAANGGVKEVVQEVSLDHDLGGNDTGMRVLDWMTAWDEWPAVLTIHTANPPARENMLRAANAEAPMSTSIYVIYR